MKKALSLMLFFMLVAGNFAYASSAGLCPTMSSFSKSTQISKAPHSCCKPSACDCKIKPASKLYPQDVNLTAAKDPSSVAIAVSGFKDLDPAFNFSHSVFSSKSPPGQMALYALHCTYRI